MYQAKTSIYDRYRPSEGGMPPEDGGRKAYWILVHGDQIAVYEGEKGVESWPKGASLAQWGLEERRQLFLGTLEGESCYAVELMPNSSLPSGMVWCGLRALYGVLEEDLFHLAGRAVQLLEWDRTHRYCGACGIETVSQSKDWSKQCPSCGQTYYARLAPAVITAILRGDQLLLARARHFRGNMHSLIAGFVEPGETLEDAVRREAIEEVGIKVTNIRYFGSQQWPFPHSLMIGFFADYDSGEIKVDGEEIVEAGWFHREGLPETPPEISIAYKMIQHYLREARNSEGLHCSSLLNSRLK